MKKIIEDIKKTIIPSEKERLSKEKIAKVIFDLVYAECKKYPEIVGVEFGGSFAKGTWLVRKADIDIFIKFKESASERTFVSLSKKIGFDALKQFKPYIRYSEHPYVEAKIKNTKVNVVPCYDVEKGKWKSSADRSPFHTKFMKTSLSSKMKNEVRLLKSFLKSQEIYGAEIARQGFSGYVTEVLILNFGSFEDTIKSIANIKKNEVIGTATKKFDTPIVIMDPIDPNRNLTAAISAENIGKFILACRAFLKNPTITFFKEKKKKITKNWNNTIVVKFEFRPRSPDIIWGQIKRLASSLSTQLELGGFRVLRNGAFTDEEYEAYLFFLVESTDIPKYYLKKGPDYFNIKDSQKFIQKNIKNTRLMWIDTDRRIVGLQKRQTNNVSKFLNELLTSKRSGIPSGLQNDIKEGFRIFQEGKGLRKSIKEELNYLVSTNETIFYSNK